MSQQNIKFSFFSYGTQNWKINLNKEHSFPQVISLEGWTDIMYYVQDAHSFWDWIYFVLLIVVSVNKTFQGRKKDLLLRLPFSTTAPNNFDHVI
jgi:Ion transport protein